jgi:hypothetical protein
VQADGIEDASKAQDDVAPTLACWWPKIELAQQAAGGGLLGVTLLYPETRKTVQNAEFFFAQPLVDDDT